MCSIWRVESTAAYALPPGPREDPPVRVAVAVTDEGVKVEISLHRSSGKTAIRVHRRSVTRWDLPDERFTHTRDFLQNLDTRGSQEVYRGKLVGRKRVVFLDSTVETNHIYAYWVSFSDGNTNPLAVRVRDRTVWWGKDAVDREIGALVGKYRGSVSVESHGATTGGWTLRGLTAGNRHRAVALVGGVHAAESGPEILLPVFERLVRDDPELLRDVGVAVLPLVNADERQRLVDGVPWYLRKNPAGVDINRNFDARWDEETSHYGMSTSNPDHETYRGTHPQSERETAAVVAFIESTRPVAVLSYHGIASATGGAFATPMKSSESYTQHVMEMVDAYWRGFVEDPALPEHASAPLSGRSGPGTLAQWVCLAFDVPAADVECGTSPECAAAELDQLTREQLDTLRSRHYRAVKSLLQFLAASIDGE